MNKKTLEYIFKQLHREAFLWARQCCSYNDEQAKEVMQMVYLKVLEEKAIYNEKSNIKTWLFAVIRNTSFDYIKTKTIHISLEDVVEIGNEILIEEENDYEQVLKKLPERQHQVLLLVFYHDMTLEEIAEVLKISIGSVRTHYDRGKKKIKELILKERIYETR